MHCMWLRGQKHKLGNMLQHTDGACCGHGDDRHMGGQLGTWGRTIYQGIRAAYFGRCEAKVRGPLAGAWACCKAAMLPCMAYESAKLQKRRHVHAD